MEKGNFFAMSKIFKPGSLAYFPPIESTGVLVRWHTTHLILKHELFFLNIFPQGPDEVRMGNFNIECGKVTLY